jgi:hypothetical protein
VQTAYAHPPQQWVPGIRRSKRKAHLSLWVFMAWCLVTGATLHVLSGSDGCCRYWIDDVSAETVDQRVQKGLFLFACTNSCMNHIVYGYFNFRSRRGSGYEVRGVRMCQQMRYIYTTTNSNNHRISPAGSHGSLVAVASLVCLVLLFSAVSSLPSTCPSPLFVLHLYNHHLLQ